MPEDITAEQVYRMFGEVKDEIHKASLTCAKTQSKCHDAINNMPEDITAEQVYRMFGEVKDEIHKVSLTCAKTQSKCHDAINNIDMEAKLHAGNTQLHARNTQLHSLKKKKDFRKNPIGSFWLAVAGLFWR